MYSKRGAPQKVDEAFISRVNEFGISPLTSERRLNLRTMSARTKERLEKKVDEQHGWALLQKQEEVLELAETLEGERYDHLLEKEAVIMRAKSQKKKAQDALTQGVAVQDKLQKLVAAAEVSVKALQREVRLETFAADKAEERHAALVAEMHVYKTELQTTRTELQQVNAKYRDADKEWKCQHMVLQAKCVDLETTQHKLQTWKDMDFKRRSHTKSTLDGLRQERDNLLKVQPRLCFS
jgi:hypothetical protein